MYKHENILIGSNIPSALSAIIMRLNTTTSNYNCITATRIFDIIHLSKTVKPSLIIICFSEDQTSLNNLIRHQQIQKIPLLFLRKNNDDSGLHFNTNALIFTQSYEYVMKSNNLSTNVHGLLKLNHKTRQEYAYKSLAEKAMYHGAYNQSKDLTRYTLELDQKRAMLDKIKGKIKQLYANVDASTKQKLMAIVNTIKIAKSDRKHWEDFKIYFEKINPDFLKQLSRMYPCLTAKDLKYCCYLKMNMSNEDIRNILGINQESVRTHKYRLKKKMVLSKEQNLRNYLQSFAE